jgi:hypothetical protein
MKKRIKSLTSAALIVILFFGCQPKDEGSDPVTRVNFEQSDGIDIGQYLEKVRFVQLENHPESAFTDIDKIIVSGSNMFLLDKRLEAVFCFDTTGKFRYRIQRVGRGPGEYQELDAIWVKSEMNELWLQSLWPSMIMVFDMDGQMLRYFPVRWSARDMVRIGDGLLAGYNSSGSNDGRDSIPEGLFLLDEDGNYERQALVIGNKHCYWSLNYQRHIEEYKDGALLLSQSDTIFRIDQRGKVSPDVFLDWGRLKYPDDLKEVGFDSPRYPEAVSGNYIFGKDQLVAFGPIRLFRVILGSHGEFALADLVRKTGFYSTRIISTNATVPLLYPIAKSDRNELIGLYDMDVLLAIRESKPPVTNDPAAGEMYQTMNSLVETALKQDRPVLWFAKIKSEWLR